MGSDDTRGVYCKYHITKAGGSPCDPEACYFVLRLDTDTAARVAARAYAEACGNRELRRDLLALVNEHWRKGDR